MAISTLDEAVLDAFKKTKPQAGGGRLVAWQTTALAVVQAVNPELSGDQIVKIINGYY